MSLEYQLLARVAPLHRLRRRFTKGSISNRWFLHVLADKSYLEEDDFWLYPYGLKLHSRTAHCLYYIGIKSLEELLNYTEEELLKCRNLGKKALEEIKAELNKIGLKLKK